MLVTAVLLALSAGVLLTWLYLSANLLKSLRRAPKIDDTIQRSEDRVDVILPARNEERFIGRCIESLLEQDANLRIIAIDDSSTDKTAEIIKGYAMRSSKVLYVDAGKKPEGWAGKNWACYQGYLRSDADLLLFTDADSIYSKNLVSLAVSRVVNERLDALTLMPRLLCFDPSTKITLPLLNVILYSRYSPLRVNNPNNPLGYFFGSFFVIRRSVYESVGTHAGVKNELVEDGALGSRVKKAGFKLMMMRAEHLFSAVWARDFNSLWHGLGRLIVPLYASNKLAATGIFLASFFLFMFPFLSLAYSLTLHDPLTSILLAINSSIYFLMTSMGIVNTRIIKINPLYALASPIAATIITLGFLSGILKGKRGKSVKWRDRDYIYSLYTADGFQP